jgi:predicted ATPase/DNA-binding CsgD family transcriptional regulator
VGDQPLLESLKQHLRNRETLLVLDNFEQVLPAGPAVIELMAVAPGLKILVTSREPLHLRAERTFAVTPLPLPALDPLLQPERLASVPSVALFVRRAQAVNADFALTTRNAPAVARICVRLDGLPLAIELAAARSNVLTPEDILARLQGAPHTTPLQVLRWDAQDLPPRHRTLHAAIDWSHDLLGSGEQALFRRLAVFVGGCTLEAAEAVCAYGLDLLSSLVDKSLVQVAQRGEDGRRFRLLETVRGYALERLAAGGELEELRERHAMYFLDLAERSDPALRGPDQISWLDRLEAEHDNLRAALTWWQLERASPELHLRLAGALYRFWWRRGHLSEGREWLARALARDAPVTEHARAKALNGAAVLAREQGDYAVASTLFEDSLAIYRALGDGWGVANALSNLGGVAVFRGEHDLAEEILQESLALWREVGDRWGIAIALGIFGRLARRQGIIDRAEALHEQSISLFRDVGDTWGVARFLSSTAHLVCERGAYDRAAELWRKSLTLFRELGEKWGVAECLEGLARVAALSRAPSRSARLFGAAQALREIVGSPLPPADRRGYEHSLATVRGDLGERAFSTAWAEGRAMPLDQAVALGVPPRDPPPARDEPSQPSRDQRARRLLSARESEVLRLVAEGMSNRQIAEALIISEPTAKFHVTSILNKLGAGTRAQAVAVAAQRGLLDASS